MNQEVNRRHWKSFLKPITQDEVVKRGRFSCFMISKNWKAEIDV